MIVGGFISAFDPGMTTGAGRGSGQSSFSGLIRPGATLAPAVRATGPEVGSDILSRSADGTGRGAPNNTTGSTSGGPPYSGPPRVSGPATTYLNHRQVVTSGGGSPDWKFGTIDSVSGLADASYLIFNVTTPQSTSMGDTLFIGESVFDTNSWYDQMGIVGGGSQGGWFQVDQTPNPCEPGSNWCAYFSFGVTGSGNCTTWHYYEFAYGPLKISESYEFTMVIAEGTIYFEVLGPNGAQTVVGESSFYTGGSYFVVGHQTYECSNHNLVWDDFTDYEEDYGNNPVEAWPAYNAHTKVVAYLTSGGYDQVPWWPYSISTPSGFPGQTVTSWSSPYNDVNIDNVNFASWVGTWFGNGDQISTVSNSQNSVTVALIDPLADPSGGFTVWYEYNFCSVPCGDVSFSPGSSTVQSDSYFYSPNAEMVVTLPAGFTTGTYLMALYAVEGSGNTYVTYWYLTVT